MTIKSNERGFQKYRARREMEMNKNALKVDLSKIVIAIKLVHMYKFENKLVT